jgi:hypothetical protein
MVEFLRLQYALGKVSASQLRNLVGVKITEDEYREIIKG